MVSITPPTLHIKVIWKQIFTFDEIILMYIILHKLTAERRIHGHNQTNILDPRLGQCQARCHYSQSGALNIYH